MKKIIYVIFIALFFYSCNDFLDTKNSATLPETEAFNTLKDCDAALNGAYRSMYNYIVTFPATFDVILNDIKYAKWGDGSYSSIRNFNWSSDNFGSTGSPWAISYSQISRVNNLLKGLEKFEEGPQVIRMKSEAYMMRAFAHFELLRLYGYKFNKTTKTTDVGIPYVTETNMDKKERLSVDATLTEIFKDLTKAEQYFNSPTIEKRNTPIYYFNIDALYALMSRIYLYMEEYSKVVEYSEKLTHYTIVSDKTTFNAIWRNDSPSTEVMLLIGLTPTEASSGFSISEYLYLGDKYTSGKPKPNFLPALEIMNIYDKTNDIRWAAYFTENIEMHSSTTNEKLTLVTKYLGNTNISTSDRINQTKYFRYAEVVLNRIEALYHIDKDDALKELNDFRKKRIAGYTDQTYSDTELLNQIKLERRKEFAFEGMRFHDLRRWNDSFARTLDAYTALSDEIDIKGDDYHWVFPIPLHEMNANELPDSYQNPKY